jgi:glutamate/tyrosine decarboxylase-like PLP-dependent enzyme
VEKFVSAGENAPMYPYEIIPCNARGEMDPDALKAAILRDAEQGVVGTVLVLTWGTTVRGAIDDVKGLTGWLKEQGLPYYCHLDAAHYGGIAANQQDSPALRDVVGSGIDSLSVSLHKFLGTARVNGVLLAIERTNRRVVEYIGQEDSTLLGSRDYLPFSTYQRVREMLWRKETNHYAENVRFFEDLLLRKGVSYQKHGRGNTFVVDKPREEVCKKYQLATFTDGDGKEYAHVIIFPFHQKGVMTGLVEELKGERHD